MMDSDVINSEMARLKEVTNQTNHDDVVQWLKDRAECQRRLSQDYMVEYDLTGRLEPMDLAFACWDIAKILERTAKEIE